jgi:uncharacterized protein
MCYTISSKGSDFLKIVIAGGSGFVGKAVSDFYINNGDEVFILTRNKQTPTHLSNVTYIEWLNDSPDLDTQLEGTDVIINLAGESINSGRWNVARKQRILQSRLLTTNEILHLIQRMKNKPKLLINASAIGYYGTSDTITFLEETKSVGNDFLAETVKDWESIALKAQAYGIRTALCRFGIILDRNGGALTKMILPYQFFIGGRLGRGKQWVSWIHLEDVIRAIHFIIKNKDLSGPINFVAPEPVTMDEFGRSISKVLHRPHWLPTPGIALRLVLGEMSMLMLEGQKVLPKKLIDNGFTFKYPTTTKALENIFPQ